MFFTADRHGSISPLAPAAGGRRGESIVEGIVRNLGIRAGHHRRACGRVAQGSRHGLERNPCRRHPSAARAAQVVRPGPPLGILMPEARGTDQPIPCLVVIADRLAVRVRRSVFDVPTAGFEAVHTPASAAYA